MVVGVPIPLDQAAAAAPTQVAIERALADAQKLGISGSNITPYLLDRIQQLTGGESLAANIRLIKNNARIGAAIAVELSSL